MAGEELEKTISVRRPGQQVAQADTGIADYFKDVPTPDRDIADYFKDAGSPTAKPGKTVPNVADTQRKATTAAEEQRTLITPEDNVDYDTGAPMRHRVNLWRASGDKGPNTGKSEQELYLKQNFGESNYRQGADGQWQVKPNWPMPQTYDPVTRKHAAKKPSGEWVSVFPRGSIGSSLATGTAASTPEMIGAGIGTVAGAPGGPVGMAAGAGFGGAAGHLVNEGLKGLQGFYDKSMGHLAADTALEGGVNATFQGAGPAWNAGKGALYNSTSRGLRNWTGVTQETGDLTRQLMRDYGVTPPVESIAPRAKALAYDRIQRNRTSGDPQAEARRGVIQQRISDILANTGMSPQERALAEQYIYNTSVGPASGRSGEMVRDAMVARNAQSQELQDAYVEDAHRALDRAVSTYSRNITTDPGKKGAMKSAGDTARALSKDVEGERENFGREMNEVADNFHNAAGGRAVVEATDTIKGLQDLIHPVPGPLRQTLDKANARMTPDDIQETVAPNVATDDIQAIMDAIAHRLNGGAPQGAPTGVAAAANDNPVMLTIQEAHRLRSALMEMVRMRGDTSPMGSRRGEIYHIVGTIDAAMDKVALEAGGTVGAGMRDFNRQWAEGIVRFTSDDINRVLRETKAGRPPDPGVVADAVYYGNKSLPAVKQIYDMLTPDTQYMVQTARLHNIIRDATIPVGKFGRPTLDADAVLESLSKSAAADKYIFGPKNPLLKQLEELAVAFKAAGGQVELDALPTGGNVVPFGRSPVGVQRGTADIIRSLQAAQAEQNAIRQEVERDVQGALRSSDPKLVDGGVRYILGSEARTIRAAEVLGAGSPEWQLLQREAKVELLRKAITPMMTGQGTTVNAKALTDAMAGLTERQQRMLLPGADLDDFQLLARQAKMLFPELSQDMGSSLQAAQTFANLPKANALRRWTWAQVAGFLADSRTVAHMLAGTLRQDPYAGRKMLSYLMQYGANVGMGSNTTQPNQAAGAEPSFDDKMRQLEAAHGPVPKKGYGGPQDH